MDREKLEKREKMMRAAEYMELTLLFDKAIEFGHMRVIDFTPSAIVYRATFWHRYWEEVLRNNIWRLLQDLRIMHRIVILDEGSEYCHLPLLDRIKEFIRREKIDGWYILFKVEMQDYDTVLSELKRDLGILITPGH